jgi:hypothetical protein
MKYLLVHKVHQITNLSECSKWFDSCRHVHCFCDTIKRIMQKTHRFTIYKTFYSDFSYRDFVNKCTYVHRNCICTKNRSNSDAITPAHMLVIIAIIGAIFLCVLGITMEAMI